MERLNTSLDNELPFAPTPLLSLLDSQNKGTVPQSNTKYNKGHNLIHEIKDTTRHHIPISQIDTAQRQQTMSCPETSPYKNHCTMKNSN